MNGIISYLKGLKLSLSSWLLVTASLIIGGLVTALRLQGGQLHKTQVDLLKANTDTKIKTADETVLDAAQKYTQAKLAYEASKKK